MALIRITNHTTFFLYLVSEHDDRGSEEGGGGGRGRRGRGGQRGRWRGRRGGRGNRGGVNPRSRLEAVDDDGDAMMDEPGSSRGR